MEKESVIVLDFGGQYNQLIARRVRECNVYCEVKPYTMSLEEIKKINPKGIIFTGGPNSVYDEKSPHYDKAIFDLLWFTVNGMESWRNCRDSTDK